MAHQSSQPQEPPQLHSQPGILRLTQPLRIRIYYFLGLHGPTERSVDLNGHKHVGPHPSGVHGLLLSCRILYEEASNLLYRTHRFHIRYSDQQSLQPLRNLRTSSLAALSHLQVILSGTSCHESEGWECYRHCCNRDPQFCGMDAQHDTPAAGDPDPRLADWDLIASHLASGIRPGILELAIICDFVPTDAGIQAATEMTRSLLRLPRLRHCSVRLARYPHGQLQQLANDAVLRACHGIPPSLTSLPSSVNPVQGPASGSPSLFLSLPRELRFRILEYSDLITPWAQVTWSPQHGGFLSSQTYCDNLEGMGLICPPSRHHGCQFSKCWTRYYGPSPGCFCRLQHSAKSSTVACQCWAPPKALFLVCRTLYKEAQAVFYSGNRFVVHDWTSDPPWKREIDWDLVDGPKDEYPHACFGASRFLKEVVPEDCLHHLRFLEFVFPPYDYNVWPGKDHSALQDWKDTIAWAKDKINVEGLTIRFITNEPSDWEQPRSWIEMSKPQALQIMKASSSILLTLPALGELRRFYARLVSPWIMTGGFHDTRVAISYVEKRLKERAERSIMGERYDAMYASGKEPEESVWHHRYKRNL
ncbi:hypothetical protein M406DRAFT_261903 [Cryphonectria parasitica EP155]|uniref:F-box domain-containing protein n=1 Tax=Cryphonectria parasitica (strain ATCC 38755 / EP155) TaxID=660469 RepID=A0A9P4XZ66_CRYP1|nr:uncharacterized protein M406DRAFT_261903 [Cryphonectria parasitica EP155]KAF3763465.1 hypothetical protein M406DRAFT_261903 [Cryphonectria parasitica EP155]